MRHGLRVLIALIRSTGADRPIRGIYRYAASRDDWTVSSIFHDDTLIQIQDLERRGADGVIVCCSPNYPADIEFLKRWKKPVVSLTPDTPWDLAPHVATDAHEACSRIVEHYRFLGRRTIAYLGLNQLPPSHHAAELVRSLCEPHGIGFRVLQRVVSLDEELMIQPSTPEQIPPVLRQWIESLPSGTGVICRCDEDGCALVRAVQILGRRVPEDVAVSGMGDEPVTLTSRPPLTSYQSPLEEKGFQAAALLDRLMKGESRPSAPISVSGGVLVVRGSTQRHPAEIQEALKIIHEDAAAGLTVKELSKRLSVSRVSLERKFLRCLGQKPAESIRLGRLETAKRLLTETDLTVELVATKSGFESASSFSKFFRERTGHSPGQFRDIREKSSP